MKLYEIPEYAVKKAQKLGATDIIVSAGTSKSQQVKFVNNEVAVTKNWQEEGAGVFFAYKKRVISANIKKFTKQEVDTTLARMISIAKLLPPKEDFYGIAQGKKRYTKVEGLYDRKLLNFDKSIDYVQAAINAGLKSGAKRVTGVFDVLVDESRVISSKGFDVIDRGTGISMSVRALASKEASGHKVANSNVLAGFDPAKVASEAGKIAAAARNPQPIQPGKYDVLFHPLPMSDLLSAVAGAGSIGSVESGMSFFKKAGQVVGSPKLTIYDWANMPYGIDSFMFDEEGTASQKTPVIVKGVFKNFLHNYSTAHKYKTKTTGSAGISDPAPSNTYVVPGKANLASMIKQIKKGLIITNTWYTTFQNYQAGTFSTIPRDAIFYVENGKLKHPTKDVRISESTINLMKSIVEIGKKPEQVASWFAGEPPSFANNVVTPPILCKKLNITKSKN
jgi:PmbA protein